MVSDPIEDSRGESHLLTSRGIDNAFHYAPLHYLLFIARSGTLYSKRMLRDRGYKATHFRRTSRRQDELRGFAEYVHLSLKKLPPILQAKLGAGFPHFEVQIPAGEIEGRDFHLCRYNIAKCRYLRRGDAEGPQESPRNGRYYGNMQLPIAVTDADRAALIEANFPKTMVEVLIPNSLPLPPNARFVFFSDQELELATAFLRPMERQWVTVVSPRGGYSARHEHFTAVQTFLDLSSREPQWKGDGLEFDSV